METISYGRRALVFWYSREFELFRIFMNLFVSYEYDFIPSHLFDMVYSLCSRLFRMKINQLFDMHTLINTSEQKWLH